MLNHENTKDDDNELDHFWQTFIWLLCRKYRGELLSFVKYNISISGVLVKVRQPTNKKIQAQVTKHYTANVRLYDIDPDLLFQVFFSFQLDVYGPGPTDAEMAKWEQVLLDVYIAEQKCSKCFWFLVW